MCQSRDVRPQILDPYFPSGVSLLWLAFANLLFFIYNIIIMGLFHAVATSSVATILLFHVVYIRLGLPVWAFEKKKSKFKIKKRGERGKRKKS